jgi:cell division septal protein FtsQ
MRSSSLKYKKARREYGKLVIRVLSFCILFLVLGVGTGLASYYKVFVVKAVEVKGTKSYVNSTDVTTLISASVLAKNMFLLDTGELESDIKNNFQGVKTVNVQRTLSGKLKVHITEREPVALVTTKRDTFGVDDDGYVLGILDPKTTNLPSLSYDGDVKVGLFIDKLIVPTYMDVLKSLDEEKIKVSSISVSDYDVRIFVDKGIEVLIARDSYSGKFAKQLKEVLNYMKTSGKSARRIDLRYDKVILSQN